MHNYLITFTDGTSSIYTFTLAELEAFVTLNAGFIVSVEDLGPVEEPPPPPPPPPPEPEFSEFAITAFSKV